MQPSAVYAIADRLAPTLRRQWLTAVAAIQDQFSIAILAEAVLRGGNSAPLNKILNSFPVQLRGAAATIVRIFEESAQQAEVEIFKRLRLGGKFDIVNPKAVDVAARQGAQLVCEVTESTREAIRAVISRAITDGIPPRDAAKLIRPLVGLTERQAMAVVNYRTSLLGAGGSPTTVQAAAERYAAKLQRQRAVNIARTETVRASSAGQQAAWDSARADGLLPSNTLKEWQAAEGERLCPICSALDGQQVPLDGVFQASGGALDGPPAHPQCLLGDTLVSPGGRIAAVSQRPFDGDVLVLHTAGGNRLSCTANHPILTPHGWVPAGGLHVGSDVIRQVRMERGVVGNVNDQHMPSRFHEVAESFRGSREMATSEVPVAAEDFHGDGRGSEVAIIWAYRLLVDDIQAIGHELTGQAPFNLGNVQSESFDRPSSALHAGQRVLAAATRCVCGRDLSGALGAIHPTPFQEFSSASVPWFDRVFDESGSDNGPGYAEVFRDLQLGLAGAVVADQLLRVEVLSGRHEVFNLQAELGWYIGNGIITHNCRCRTSLVFPKGRVA